LYFYQGHGTGNLVRHNVRNTNSSSAFDTEWQRHIYAPGGILMFFYIDYGLLNFSSFGICIRSLYSIHAFHIKHLYSRASKNQRYSFL